jgi:hypothetical protein
MKYLHGSLLYEDGVNNLNRVVRLADGSLYTMGCIYKDVHHLNKAPKRQYVFNRRSYDGGISWTSPAILFEIPERYAHSGLLAFMTSRTGSVHVFMERIRVYDWKNNDFQGDILYARLEDIHGQGARICKIDCLDRYTGSMNNLIQLENGRLVVPLSTLRPGLPSFVSNTLYSDDDGLSWQVSNDVLVISDETHCESGAVEPVIIETEPKRLVMIIRTVLGCFYYATSTDGGASWSQARASRIKSSNAPAVLEKLPDGRIVMAWNNCNGAPMQGVRYSFARQCLHAAVSDDGLKTLQGCRMIVKKVQGDPDSVKNCYPLAALAGPDSVYLRFFTVDSKDGEDWTEPNGKLMELPVGFLQDAEWFDSDEPDYGCWVMDAATEKCTQDADSFFVIRPHDAGPGYAMTNFPFGQAGTLSLDYQTDVDFTEARLILADHYLDRATFLVNEANQPYQAYLETQYLALPLSASRAEAALPVRADSTGLLTLTWDVADSVLTLTNGQESLELPIPPDFSGFNHLGVVVPESAGGCFAVHGCSVWISRPGLATGISFTEDEQGC